MKKLAFLLLLCVFSAFMSDKNEKLESQLGGIQKEVLKWYQELNDFKKWDTDNNGFLDVAEKAALDAGKKEILLILKRLLDVSKLKGLNMPFAGIVEKMLEKTVKDSVLDIPKRGFAEIVEEIIAGYKKAILELKNDEVSSVLKIKNDYSWESKFIFSTHNDKIIIDLKADFLKVLNSSGGKTIDELAGLLNEMLNSYSEDNVSKYYSKEYKGKAITASIINGMFPSTEELKKAIESGIDKTDEVKKKEEEVKKKEEEDAFEKFKAFFTAGMANEKDKIEAISTLGDTAFLDFRIMNVEMLHSNKREISSVAYSEGFKEYVVAGLIIFVKSKKLCSAAEAKVEAKKLLDDFCEENSLRELYRLYKQKKQHSYPSGFASCINQSTVSIDLKNFENHFKTAWADKAVSAVDSFQRELKSKGLNFKADRALLESNLKRILGVGIGKNNTQPGLEIHKTFMALIPADNILDYAVIDSCWEKTIAESVKPDFMNNLCSKYFIEGAANTYDIEEAINSIDSILPNIDAIAVELYNSRYYAKPLPKPKSENPLMIRVTINKVGREKQLMDLVLDIPLRFEVRKAKNNELLYHPVPSMDLSNVTVRNAFGFSVSAVQKVYVGKTIDDTKNGFLETKTDYCWRLTVIDTSEQTVIQEPKVGEMIMVDASMGKLTGLDEVGIDPLGFSIKFVGNENGHCEKILGKITLMGLPFVVGWGKEGAIGYFENPMAFKEAELQYKYGNQNLDLYISCQVNTFIGTDYSINVDANKIKLGMQDGSFVPEGLNLNEKSSQVITIERPGKVQ